MEHKGNILLVEDNQDLNIANSRALKLRGYAVQAVRTIAQAQECLATQKPDVILLDVMLPDGDGFAFCEEARAVTSAHILFLTAKTKHEDMMLGLSAGGDDYITKPFHPEELLMRIEIAMRRRNMDKTSEVQITKGAIMLDIASSQAFISGTNLALTPKEFSLLFLLVQRNGKMLSKDLLYEEVWKQPMAGDGKALWQQISRLKRKLEGASGGAVSIFAIRGKGYSLEMIEK